MQVEGQTGERRERKLLLVRQRIYDAALASMRERGFEGATMQDIASLADVSRATVFNHFATKDDFLVQYHREMTEAVLGSASPAGGASATSAIEALLRRFCVWAENDRPMAAVIIGRIFASPVLLEQDRVDEMDLAAWLGAAVERGRASGEFRASVAPGVLVPLVIGALSSTALEWVLSGMHGQLWTRLEPRLHYLTQAARSEAS